MQAASGRHRALALLSGLFIVACSDAPGEPVRGEGAKTAASPTQTTSASEVDAGDVDVPLKWDAPAGWSITESSRTSPRRAGYSIPPIGNDKDSTELLVLYFGKGPNGERDVQWDSWLGQFDGDAKKDATRGSFEVGNDVVETFEFLGSYKLNMGPQRRGMKKSPVQMVKKDHRMIGAVVKTKTRGNWFFRLVGPDQTVLASKDAFMEMLKSVR